MTESEWNENRLRHWLITLGERLPCVNRIAGLRKSHSKHGVIALAHPDLALEASYPNSTIDLGGEMTITEMYAAGKSVTEILAMGSPGFRVERMGAATIVSAGPSARLHGV